MQAVQAAWDLDGETRVVMEATGNYHLPVAGFLYDSGFYVSVVNAMLVHGYGNNSLRRAKTDKKDAIKLANYGLDHYASACGHFSVMPKIDTAKLLVDQAVSQLRAASASLTALRNEMQSLAASLPEYPVVMGMFGVGPALGPQLMAEIGDVRRFHCKQSFSGLCRCGRAALPVWYF